MADFSLGGSVAYNSKRFLVLSHRTEEVRSPCTRWWWWWWVDKLCSLVLTARNTSVL